MLPHTDFLTGKEQHTLQSLSQRSTYCTYTHFDKAANETEDFIKTDVLSLVWVVQSLFDIGLLKK